MKQHSITSNIIYSIITQLASFIAPLIISPYISRVFNANIIGDYSYTMANSSYFVLAEGLGLALYGMLKVSQIRDDKAKLSIFFWEIFWLKTVLMLLCIALYVALFIINGETRLKDLYIIMTLNIIANGIDVTWFLSGLEEFKTVAIRTVMVRLINILLVLLCVKSTQDVLLYAWIMQGSVAVSYCMVLPIAMKQVYWINPKRINLLQHITPSFAFFIPGLVNTIFSSADKSILGALSRNSFEVGVYEQANKVCQLCAGCINAVSNAVLPRAAYLFKNAKDSEEANKFVFRTIQFALMFSIPITIGIAIISDQFIPWFFGKGYEKSAILLSILCFNVLFTSTGNFISQQCLIARGRQKEYNFAIILGASMNIILNLILVNKLMSVGVSIASSVSSFIVFALVLYQSRELITIGDMARMTWKYIVAVSAMCFAVMLCTFEANSFIQIMGKILVGTIVYFLVLYILRDGGVMSLLERKDFIK